MFANSARSFSISALESTQPLVNSFLGQLGQVYSACCYITKGDVHDLVCQNVYVINTIKIFFFFKFEMFYFEFIK